jgi:hypothetical protein
VQLSDGKQATAGGIAAALSQGLLLCDGQQG